MKYFFLLLFLLALPASASEDYTYLFCTGLRQGRVEYENGKVEKINSQHLVYITLDEVNKRIRMGQVRTTGRWKEAAFTSSTIFQENDLGFGPTSIDIDRNTGEYIMESNKEYPSSKSWTIMAGTCTKQAPKKF